MTEKEDKCVYLTVTYTTIKENQDKIGDGLNFNTFVIGVATLTKTPVGEISSAVAYTDTQFTRSHKGQF